MNGAFHFLRSEYIFLNHVAEGWESADARYMEWLSSGNPLPGGTQTNMIWPAIHLGSCQYTFLANSKPKLGTAKQDYSRNRCEDKLMRPVRPPTSIDKVSVKV